MILIAGTSNQPLVKRIAKESRMPIGMVEITRFIDSECRVYVKDDVAGEHIYVVQSLSQVADQHLVELCLIGQALKGLDADRVTAVVPWMGYSKQDKEFRKGEAVSAQLVAKFIEAAGFDDVVTVELHSENVVPYFKIPVHELHTHELLAGEVTQSQDTVVISPDYGGKSRSESFAESIGLPVVYLEKTRDLESGKVAITSTSAPVDGKTAIIYDDIINTGSTAIEASAFLKSQGAKTVSVLATHAVLAGEAHTKLSESQIDSIVVTDTIAIPPDKQIDKLRHVSIAPALTELLKSL